ncbi:helix-turn-helix domain-containing protein [Aestuariivirga sp.]|uniref:helix-turn-helix domain-containing protein n=1 Tax=Aestuariivirga sp. TaxID=2650926 RepID=UPI0039E44C21
MRVKKSSPKTSKTKGRAPRARASSHSEASDLAVGARLKAVRVREGLSQRELAKRSGVTNATISLIEQDTHAPSLASLHRILTAIPISIADFFAIPVTDQNALFYEAGDLAVVTRGAADLRVLGSERRDKKLQLFIERYKPGASTGAEPISFDGETAAIVIEGTIEVEIDGKKNRITAGGGYQLFANRPYRLRNAGRTIATVVCACTPPLF